MVQVPLGLLPELLTLRARAHADLDLVRPEIVDLVGRHYALVDPEQGILAAVRILSERLHEHHGWSELPNWLRREHSGELRIAGRFFLAEAGEGLGVRAARELFRQVWRLESGRGPGMAVSVVPPSRFELLLGAGFRYIVGSGHRDREGRAFGLMLSRVDLGRCVGSEARTCGERMRRSQHYLAGDRLLRRPRQVLRCFATDLSSAEP